MKSSISLIEILVSIILISTIFIYSTLFIKELSVANRLNQSYTLLYLELNSLKVFLEKNKDELKDELSFRNGNLYFKNNLLFENILSFDIIYESNFARILILPKDSFLQTWIIKLWKNHMFYL